MFKLQVQGFTTTNRCRKKNHTKIFFFKSHQNLRNTFLLELRKKIEMGGGGGVTVLVCALQAKLSPTVISTLAKHPQIQ